jgi:hypothetical protein
VSKVLRCRRCGEVIGVYEPLIRVTEGHTVETSRAVDPQVSGRDAEPYHRACFELLGETQPSAG